MKQCMFPLMVSLATCLVAGCDMDTDGDGVPDVSDLCPLDPDKTQPGECGCGIAEGACSSDTDSDQDGTPDQDDNCPLDPNKILPGKCGCGVGDSDSDNDNTADCADKCPSDPNKIQPGECGCGVAEGSCSQNDPIITASDENTDNGEGKEMAFDGNVNTKWLAFADSAWIQIEFGNGKAKVIKGYSLGGRYQDVTQRDRSDILHSDLTLGAISHGSVCNTEGTRSCGSTQGH